jgi:hypothetical protein
MHSLSQPREFWGELLRQIGDGEAAKFDAHPANCVTCVVVSVRQISVTHETSGCRSYEVRKGKRCTAGVGPVEGGKRYRMRRSAERIPVG